MFGLSLYAKLAAAAVLLVVLTGTHWKAYRAGADHIQAAWTAEKLKQAEDLAAKEKEYRAREQQLVAAKNKAEERYVQSKKRTALAVDGARVELDGLRSDIAARGLPRASEAPAAGTGADAAATGEALFAECARDFTRLAEEADRIRDTLIGLQSYVASVCKN